MFLVDNKANRKHHEASQKHKNNMKRYIEKASKSTSTPESTKHERISVYEKTIHNYNPADQNDQLVFESSNNHLLTRISPATLLQPSAAPLIEMKQSAISKLKINLHSTITNTNINSIEEVDNNDQEDEYQQLDLNPSKKKHIRKYSQ